MESKHAKPELLFTNGADTRFLALCAELDGYLNAQAGGAEQRSQYIPLNDTASVHTVALLLENGQAVACGGYKDAAPGTVEVKRVFVRPACRGRGYAKTLMTALEDRARAAGYTRLILETGRTLAPAVRLYASLGYQVIPNYGPYQAMPDSICMEKRL